MNVRFNALIPGDDAAAVEPRSRRVIDQRLVRARPGGRSLRSGVRRAVRRAARVGVGTGTDAIALILRALDIGPGDEVITSPLSAAYSALAIMMAGARPVFADIDPERLTLDPAAAAAAVTSRTRAILPVHLYGQAADMAALEASRQPARTRDRRRRLSSAPRHRERAARSGPSGSRARSASIRRRTSARWATAAQSRRTMRALARRIKRLRNGGQTSRYHHHEAGANSRLDELQAAILRARLPFLAAWTERRRATRAAYRRGLTGAPGRRAAEPRRRARVSPVSRC